MGTVQTRQTSTGEVRYKAVVRLKGHPTETATFARKTDAKKWMGQVEAAIQEGRYFKTAAARRHTLADLLDRYVNEVLPTKPKSGPGQKVQLDWWRKELGAYVLGDITPDLIAKGRNKLLRETTRRGELRSPATVNRYLAALSHALTVAVREFGWLGSNPARNVTRPQEPRGRVRFLSDDERDRLLKAAREDKAPYLYPVVVLGLATGMRRGEILNLTWGCLDLEEGRAVLFDTKNGETRVVPITGHALELMRQQRQRRRTHDNDLVFAVCRKGFWKPWSVQAAWDRVVKAAGLSDFRFHDLRHSAASYLAMNGATAPEIAAVLGHKTLQMVKRYSHLSEPHTHSIVTAMNAKVFEGKKS